MNRRKLSVILIVGMCLALWSVFSIDIDAADWVQVQRVSGTYRDVIYAGGKFVAVGDAGLSSSSTDGLAWTDHSLGILYNLYQLEYGNGLYVAVGHHGMIYTSANGTSWTQRRPDDGMSLTSITYNGTDLFVAAGVVNTSGSYSGQTRFFTSPDGITWTEGASGMYHEIDTLTYANGLYIAGGDSGSVYRSTNGTKWTKCNVNTGVNNKASVYDKGVYVVGGGANATSAVYYSPDGVTWTKGTYSPTSYFMDMSTDGQHIIACGDGNLPYGCSMIMASHDGINWVRDRTPDFSTLIGCASSSTRSVATGTRKLIITNTREGIGEGKGCGGVGTFISVSYPKGGECLIRGKSVNITWTSNGVSDNVRIKLSTDGGNTYTVLGDNVPNSGSFTWEIPSNYTTSKNCYVKVNAYNIDGLPAGTSAAAFSIGDTACSSTGYLRMDKPTDGETLYGGSGYTIKWTTTGVTDPIRIRLSTDGGTNYDRIVADSVASSGSFYWIVPTGISSTKCKLKILALNQKGVPYDFSNGLFTIVSGGTKPTIEIKNPGAGAKVGGGATYQIKWSESKKYDSISIEFYNGTSWTVLTDSSPDKGFYFWKVPNINVSGNKARLWIKGTSTTGNAVSNSEYFTITAMPGTITVTSPNGGEVWPQSSNQTITWTTTGTTSGTVSIYYSTDSGGAWTAITTSAPNNGSYQWTVPSTVKSDYSLIKISDSSQPLMMDISDNLLSLGGQKQIGLDKTKLNFGYILGGSSPCPQTIFIMNTGGGTLSWSAAADSSYIKVSPETGNGDGYITVSIDPTGLSAGLQTGKITITDPNASNSPQTVNVNLTVKAAADDQAPFGDFATPVDGTIGISGSIPVTGWALDDMCIESVKIYRVLNTNGDLAIVGNTTFVEGARPDVAQLYPDAPNYTRAGWGYMMLTNFLPDGQVALRAIAKDTVGHETVLGTKTITIDNAGSKKPFGAIDSPAPGGSLTGKTARNSGWALTPQPNKIPTDGSTITVWIDSVFVGKAKYNVKRDDIAKLFPNFQNSNGAMAYYDFDSTTYANGTHTISWGVTDSGSNTAGIGSMYFTILNPTSAAMANSTSASASGEPHLSIMESLMNSIGSIAVKNGFSNTLAQTIYPDDSGVLNIEMKELDRIEIELDETRSQGGNETSMEATKLNPIDRIYVVNPRITGYMMVGDELQPLPVGSKVDRKTGKFYWHAGPGYVGRYDLVFFIDRDGVLERKQIHINIAPGSTENLEYELK